MLHAVMQALNSETEIIDLGSDSEGLDFSNEDLLTLDDIEATFEGDGNDPDDLRFGRIPDVPRPQPFQIDTRTRYEICLSGVLEVFPDISHDHVRQLYDTWTKDDGTNDGVNERNVVPEITTQILDAGKYPKEKDRMKELKRKRSPQLSSDEEEEAQWKDAKRELDARVYDSEARAVLQGEFVYVPAKFIDTTLKDKGHFFASYLALELAEHTYLDSEDPPYTRLKAPRKNKITTLARLEEMEAKGYAFQELKREVVASRNRRQKIERKRQAKKDIAAAEAATEEEYRNNGDVFECLCCYESYPINKLTHCEGDELHFFCLECAETYAKNEIGNSRYELLCMAGDGCKALFSREQKHRFLNASSFEALERIQQRTELRLAELQNLATCPFCDFAAICPPITVDKEFRCGNPKCEKISCRLCRLDSHLPLTCSESKKENGISERHVLEEARTDALLRTCPKCKVKILKDDGCNKVICTCGGMLCDFCGKDISTTGYIHFDSGVGRSGGTKCPTYDNFHIRRNKEIEKAEAAAIKQVRAENPSLTAEDLKINFKEVARSPPKHYQNPMIVPPRMGFPNRPGFPDQRGVPVLPDHYRARVPQPPQDIPAMNPYPNAFQPNNMPQPRPPPVPDLQQELENMRRAIDDAQAAHALRVGRLEPVNIDDRVRAVEAEVGRRARARAERANERRLGPGAEGHNIERRPARLERDARLELENERTRVGRELARIGREGAIRRNNGGEEQPRVRQPWVLDPEGY